MKKVPFILFAWLVPVLFLLHNLEEVLFMGRLEIPDWSPLGRFRPGEFRLATVLLTVAVAGIALAVTLHPRRATLYLLVGAQTMIFENALFHIAASIALWGYNPGVVTAAFLTLPFSLLFFRKAVREDVVPRKQLPLFFGVGLLLMPMAIFLSLSLARLVTA